MKLTKKYNKNRNIHCFIQARFLSTRLVGKVLRNIGGFSSLQLCVNRMKQSEFIDKIVVLTGDAKENISIIEHCKKLEVETFVGPEENVLERFVLAAEKYNSDVVIRITADCPLVDPALVDKGITNLLENDLDYVSNTQPVSFPDGLDFEVFKIEALKCSHKATNLRHDLEHVTPYLRNNDHFKRGNIANYRDHSKYRWTLDDERDLDFLRLLISGCSEPVIMSYSELFQKFLDENLDEHESQSTERNMGAKMTKSAKLYKRAKEIMPGGTSLLSKRPEMFDPKDWPAYFRKCSGIEITSLDGETFKDFSTMSVGSCTLGYGDKVVDAAVCNAVKNGVSSSLNAPEEIYLAEKLIELHPWSNQVRFARTGGEANAIAIRIARAATGRNNVSLCGYHGWHDWYLSANLASEEALDNLLLPGLSATGVNSRLRGTTLTFEYGDVPGFEKSVGPDTACVIMEFCRNSKPDIAFLEYVKKYCNSNGVVLIFDECSSGFRESYGGIHLNYSISPDLCMIGKAVANGYALTAVIGTNEIMSIAQNTFISSTFWTERIGPSAALATLDQMKTLESYSILPSIGREVTRIWQTCANEFDLIKIKVGGFDAIPNFSFQHKSTLALKTLFTRLMLAKGYLSTTSFYASIKHTPDELRLYQEAVFGVFEELDKLLKTGVIDELDDNEICHAGFKRLN